MDRIQAVPLVAVAVPDNRGNRDVAYLPPASKPTPQAQNLFARPRYLKEYTADSGAPVKRRAAF